MGKLSFSLSRKALAWLSVFLLLVSLLPLYAISLYNHPFYDDFGFSILTHSAWRETGNLGAVLEAAWHNTVGIRQTWQGMYTASFISAMQPGIFGESHYGLTTFMLLTLLLLALAFFLWQVLRKGLGVDLPAFWVAFSGTAFLMIQFIPDVTEAFFWFNGGVGYTLMQSIMLTTAGFWLLLERCQGRGKAAALFCLTLAFNVLAGGGSYSMLLFYSLVGLLFTCWAFTKKRPKRWLHLALVLCLWACFAFSMTAPGNLVRAKTLHGGMSAPMAIAQSLYFGFALMGHWFSLPLAAILLLIVALIFPSLWQSRFSFAHPVWFTLLCAGLFCAQLTPTLFTGNYLGDGRVLNIYFFIYVLMTLGLVLYWTGWLLRRPKALHLMPVVGENASRVRSGLLALAAVLLFVGCLSYHPDGAQDYGPQNMAGGSAMRSLLRGEAQQYDREMDARDAVLNDPSQPDVTLSPIAVVPKVFMGDALQGHALDYVLSLYAEYYQKASVSVTPKGE